jgi:hypothetical protein
VVGTAVLAVTLSAVAVGASAAQSTQPNNDAQFDSLALHSQNVGPPGTAFWTEVPPRPPANAKPGDILWVQRRADAPRGSVGWDVVYVSEIQPGVKNYVAGEIFVPSRPSHGQRNVVLWNHPTAGLNDDCAPSRQTLGQAGNNNVPALDELIDAGNLVVASDYPGLGLAGPAYYMAGDPNARASLDIIRAARTIPELRASANFVQYGWSQGGQTSEHVDTVVRSYAPELRPLGTAMIAPATRIRDLTLNSMQHDGLAGYVIMTLRGIQAANPDLKYRDFLTVEGMEALPELTDGCWDIFGNAAPLQHPYQPNAMTPDSPWSNAMAAVDDFNPGGTMPYLIFQGSADDAVLPAMTRHERDVLCAAGSRVQYNEVSGKDHESIVPVAAKAFPQWAADRFAGEPAPTNCPA